MFGSHELKPKHLFGGAIDLLPKLISLRRALILLVHNQLHQSMSNLHLKCYQYNHYLPIYLRGKMKPIHFHFYRSYNLQQF